MLAFRTRGHEVPTNLRLEPTPTNGLPATSCVNAEQILTTFEFYKTSFSYIDAETGREVTVAVPEQGGRGAITHHLRHLHGGKMRVEGDSPEDRVWEVGRPAGR